VPPNGRVVTQRLVWSLWDAESPGETTRGMEVPLAAVARLPSRPVRRSRGVAVVPADRSSGGRRAPVIGAMGLGTVRGGVAGPCRPSAGRIWTPSNVQAQAW